MLHGQHPPDSAFGRVLAQLAARPDLRTFVEVGTWNGQGTTASLMQGLQARDDDWMLVSLETNPVMHARAVQHWGQFGRAALDSGRLRLVLGRLGDEVMDPADIEHHPLVQPQWREWYRDEARDFLAARRVGLRGPVHVAVLDGGEFTTRGDWGVLRAMRPRVVALDDVNAVKCHDVFHELRADPAWRLVDTGDEGNGWAVFEVTQTPA